VEWRLGSLSAAIVLAAGLAAGMAELGVLLITTVGILNV